MSVQIFIVFSVGVRFYWENTSVEISTVYIASMQIYFFVGVIKLR